MNDFIKDSNIIFTAISTGNFDNFQQAMQVIATLYITDLNFSRAGISHAIKRLDKFYAGGTK